MDVQVTRLRGAGANLVLEVVMPLAAISPRGDATPAAHTIIISPAALDNRRALYGLASDEEALQAILREHAQRLNALPPEEGADTRLTRLGGLRADVAVDTSGAAVTVEAAELLNQRTRASE